MQQTQQFQTKQLVNDYIGWRLATEGYSQWNVANKIDINRNGKIKICQIMRQMAFEFEKRYNSDYLPLADHFNMTATYLSETFPLILAELFQINKQDNTESVGQSFDCNWCRVIALFGFAGCLAIRCFKSEMPDPIKDITDWTIKFLNCDPRMYNWIVSRGGWNGFIDFFSDEKINIIKNSNSSSSSNTSFIEKTNKKFEAVADTSQRSTTVDNEDEIYENKNFEINKFEKLQLNAKDVFCKISRLMAVTVGSIGVLMLGLIYFKKSYRHF